MRISDWSSDVCSSDLAVSAKSGREVIPDDIVLGFFSFATFLMYRDLDPSTWPDSSQINARALVRGFLQDGFPTSGSRVPEDANIEPCHLPYDLQNTLDRYAEPTEGTSRFEARIYGGE